MGGNAVNKLLALAVVALIAFGLAACGGSDDSKPDQSTATTPGQTATTTPSSGDDHGATEKESGDDKGGGGEDRTQSGGASSEFLTHNGDNSIQTYGKEADTSEVEEAEEAIVSYLDARAAGDWAKSCEHLAAVAKEPLEKLGESTPKLKGKGCAGVIGALSARIPAEARTSPVVEGIASVRFKGDRGFALFHGPDETKLFIPLVREDGQWKVGALVPSEFP